MPRIPEHDIVVSSGKRLLLYALTKDVSRLPCRLSDICEDCVNDGLIVYYEPANEAKLTPYGEIVKETLEK